MTHATIVNVTALRSELDLVTVRQRARQIGIRLGFDQQDQVRIAAAVSEIARNVIFHRGGGRAEFVVDAAADPMALLVRTVDRGPTIADPDAPPTFGGIPVDDFGRGLRSAQRLVDGLRVQSEPGGDTVVEIRRTLPRRMASLPQADIAALSQQLAAVPSDPIGELRQQHGELLASLDELRRRQEELTQLNRELEETNRGVVALYAELEERAESLRRAGEAKTRFFSQISHEFRTPLNSIVSLSALLLDRADGDLGPEQEKQVSYIRNGALALIQLVNDLLDLGKVEAGQATVQPTSFRLEALFGMIRGTLRPLASSTVALRFVLADDLPPVYTDEGKLAQILRNLIANALKFTEKGEVLVSAAREPGEMITFSVRDTGIGIAPEDQERIFEDFVQIDNELQRRTKGTGLGLSLSKRLVELLGGTIRVESAIGKGSTFTFSVPAFYRSAEEAQASAALGSVLIVEDEEAFRYVLRRILRDAPYRCHEVGDGMEALERIKSTLPDVVLLDLRLPQLDGFEVLRRLGENPITEKIPVIVMTASSLTGEERRRLSRAVAVMTKQGVTRQKLLDMLSLARGWRHSENAGSSTHSQC